jgi:iron complex transport system substrate-binding protein
VRLKIASLIPAATEIVYLLGLEKHLVARSTDSNYPKKARKIPAITEGDLDPKFATEQINSILKGKKHKSRSINHIDKQKLKAFSPNLILTQELCEICAPSYTQVKEAVKILKGKPTIVSIEPNTIDGIFSAILEIGLTAGKYHKAKRVVESLKKRVKLICQKTKTVQKPSVLVIEWLNPIMVAGHWVPEMVEYAGGKPVLTKKGRKSKQVRWSKIKKANPDIILLAVCGFDIPKTKKDLYLLEKRKGWKKLKAVRNGKVFIVDGDAYFTRCGPRVVEGIEILAKIIHPQLFRKPTKKCAYRYMLLARQMSSFSPQTYCGLGVGDT